MSPKCFSNSDCQAGEVCVLPDRDDPSRQCCLPDELCLMIYPVCEGVCALPKGVCWTDADCPRGEFCNILRCDPGQRCAGPYECRPYNQ
jgi:Cys-rich repeat protein